MLARSFEVLCNGRMMRDVTQQTWENENSRFEDEGFSCCGEGSGPVNWSCCVKGCACFQEVVGGRELDISGRCATGRLSGSFGKEDPHGCYRNGWLCG